MDEVQRNSVSGFCYGPLIMSDLGALSFQEQAICTLTGNRFSLLQLSADNSKYMLVASSSGSAIFFSVKIIAFEGILLLVRIMVDFDTVQDL